MAVVAYGDNGERYGWRYLLVEGSRSRLELWTEVTAIDRLSDELSARLDDRVRADLEADGYELHQA